MAEKKVKNEASSSGGGGGTSRGESVTIDVGRRRSSCGYCRSGGRTSISHGLWAHSLTVYHYQALLDRGWRRSGQFLYKPEMERTCCPSYTIRLKASDFISSKEQLRVFKRMERYLDGTLDLKKKDEFMDEPNSSKGSCSRALTEMTSSAVMDLEVGKNEVTNKLDQFMHHCSKEIDNAVKALVQSGESYYNIELPKASIKHVASSKRKFLAEGSEELWFSSNISFQIAAALRRAEKDAQNSVLSGDSEVKLGQSLELSPKIIAEKLASSLNSLAESYDLSVRACNGHINFYSTDKYAWLNEVVERSLVPEATTGSGSSCSKKVSEHPQGRKRRLEIRLKRSSFDAEEFALYRRYQLKVHNDTEDHVTESSYMRFLVDTPLIFVPSTGNGTVPSCGFGSFHQQYLIDGQLVAVGVIDILPKCLSSKYLFWDPDLASLSLGKYSALKEIGWVKDNQHNCPSLEFYYLGYYIHSCNKMRYKAAYSPSELLCPLRYKWVPFDIAKPLLDRRPYVILSDYTGLPNGAISSSGMLENIVHPHHDDPSQEDTNDIPMDEDEEMAEVDSDDSDEKADLQSSDLPSLQVEGSVNDILIRLNGVHLGYKDLHDALSPSERSYWETRLLRYMRAVGAELSKQMVYSLG